MQHNQEKFEGKKGLQLYSQSWLPSEPARAILIIVHGIAEHSGRYQSTAHYFASKGHAVYALDHRGHGRSEGSRGHVEHFSYFLDDLDIFIKKVRLANVGKKVFLFGHSMGAAISLGYALDHPGELTGLILSGTALDIKPEMPVPLIYLLSYAAAVVPTLRIKKLDSAHLSHDSAVVAAYNSDPLVFRGRLSLRITVDLLRETLRLKRLLSRLQIPLIILHGTADELTMPKGSRMIFERASTKDKTAKYYEGFYHEILNEPERDRVLKDIELWIDRH